MQLPRLSTPAGIGRHDHDHDHAVKHMLHTIIPERWQPPPAKLMARLVLLHTHPKTPTRPLRLPQMTPGMTQTTKIVIGNRRPHQRDHTTRRPCVL